MTEPEEVLDFWFGTDSPSGEQIDSRSQVWFGSDPEFDRSIRARFGSLPDAAMEGRLDGWLEDPRHTVALVLVLDQLPRNLHRGEARSFAYDARALGVTLAWLAAGGDHEVAPIETVFGYLPLEHAEDLGCQERCVSLYRRLAGRVAPPLREPFESFVAYAERHRKVIERFGRFPHRNPVLGREPTPEEVAYLESGGDTF